MLARVSGVIFFLFVGLLAAQDVRYNQFQEAEYNGIQRHVLKLSLGYGEERSSTGNFGLLLGRFQYLVTDFFAIRGETGYAMASPQGTTYIPFTLGGDLHILPRSALDIYLGGDGGFLYIDYPVAGNGVFARTSLHGGVTFYFWGAFFLDVEARYNVQHFARSVVYDLSGLGWNVHVGFYF
ncbi:MAG: hypothetical protein NZM25_01575 [Leptospiraceae bacterium]|nr:hypothetical protein [Leptospiraceae bacterium]MDW8307635.1 hypothetical protein [Leptospiraceae bacterium]